MDELVLAQWQEGVLYLYITDWYIYFRCRCHIVTPEGNIELVDFTETMLTGLEPTKTKLSQRAATMLMALKPARLNA